MTETEWRVGDEVVISSNHGRTLHGPYKITAVTARQLTVSDGSKWTNRPWPARWGTSRDRFPSGGLRRVDENALEIIATQKREARARRLSEFLIRIRERVTDAQLDAIEQALSKADG